MKEPTLREDAHVEKLPCDQFMHPVTRFKLSNGHMRGMPYWCLLKVDHNPELDALTLTYTTGTILIVGPRSLEFGDKFCAQQVTNLRADGKGIVSIIEVVPERD